MSSRPIPFPSFSHDIYSSPEQSSPAASSSSASRPYCRVSCLPPPPTIPGRSTSSFPQRYLYFAVRHGFVPGVYTSWHDVERQIVNYPQPALKTFSTRLAAEAYVSGWNGAGRHSLPLSTPRPLREHLAMNFPGSVNVSAPSSQRRQSYHARLFASASETAQPSPGATSTTRTGSPSKSPYRTSMVRISSPLRQEVDDQSEDEMAYAEKHKTMQRAARFMGAGGLLSPPQSPEKEHKTLSVLERERPTVRRGPTESGTWASRNRREFNRPITPPTSPTNPTQKRASAQSPGLWADSMSAPAPRSAAPVPAPAPEFVDTRTPTFSRAGMKRAGVVMPVSAKTSTPSLSSRSRLSLSSPNGSSSSLASSCSNGSAKDPQRPSHTRSRSSLSSMHSTQDRLSTLAESCKRESHGPAAIPALSPPRPSFMRRVSSNSSIESNDSVSSMSSMTSGSSAQPSLESCETISEESESEVRIQQPVVDDAREREKTLGMGGISCTSESVVSGSMVNEKMGKKKSGGMMRKFAKALKM